MVELTGERAQKGDVVFERVRATSAEGAAALLGARVCVFEDGGDGVFQPEELRGTTRVASPVPSRVLEAAFFRIPGTPASRWIHAELEATQGTVATDWAYE